MTIGWEAEPAAVYLAVKMAVELSREINADKPNTVTMRAIS